MFYVHIDAESLVSRRGEILMVFFVVDKIEYVQTINDCMRKISIGQRSFKFVSLESLVCQ